MAVKKLKLLACRFCGDEIDASNRDVHSGWTHSHPSVCPYRQDSVPSLNGVHVGDEWRNLHTKKVSVVTAIKLGGAGVYTDREPVIILGDLDHDWESPHPMWSLAEHWESLTRPGEWPVPWTRSKRFVGRTAHLKWRGPGYRGRRKRRGRQYVYWHSYHFVDEYSIEWHRTDELWQIRPQEERALVEAERMREAALELLDSDDELLNRVGRQMAEIFAEAA